MDKSTIYQDMNPAERLEALRNLAVVTSEEDYGKKLSKEEHEQKKNEFISGMQELHRREAKLKAVVDEHKAEIKAQQAVNDEVFEMVVTGRTPTYGVLYGIPDRDENLMRFYDETGEEIKSRPLTPKEHQGSVFLDGARPDEEVQDVEFEEVTDEELNELYDEETGEVFEPEEKPKK